MIQIQRMLALNRSLVFASFDIVVNDQGEHHENPHGEDAHSGDGFCDKTRQDHPSTAED